MPTVRKEINIFHIKKFWIIHIFLMQIENFDNYSRESIAVRLKK